MCLQRPLETGYCRTMLWLPVPLPHRLPSIRLDRPRFVMTASCPSTVAVKEHFKVKYVLLNNLQDFLAVRLVWTPEGQSLCLHTPVKNSAPEGCSFTKRMTCVWICVCSGRGQGEDSPLSAVVCHTPLSNLGHCRKGSTLSFSVAFQILKPGLYEVSPGWIPD